MKLEKKVRILPFFYYYSKINLFFLVGRENSQTKIPALKNIYLCKYILQYRLVQWNIKPSFSGIRGILQMLDTTELLTKFAIIACARTHNKCQND